MENIERECVTLIRIMSDSCRYRKSWQQESTRPHQDRCESIITSVGRGRGGAKIVAAAKKKGAGKLNAICVGGPRKPIHIDTFSHKHTHSEVWSQFVSLISLISLSRSLGCAFLQGIAD